MWLLLYTLVLLSMIFSTSPFFGMLGLFTISVTAALVLGTKNTWLLTVMVLVYVGGVMVMFTYMTSVISSSKILSLGARPAATISLFLSFMLMSKNSLTTPNLNLWPGVGFVSEELPFLGFMVGYMLFALMSVFMILNKEEGPMKMK